MITTLHIFQPIRDIASSSVNKSMGYNSDSVPIFQGMTTQRITEIFGLKSSARS